MIKLAGFLSISLLPFAAAQQGPLHDAEDRVIHYNESENLADPVSALEKGLANGNQRLDFEPSHGYLVPLLRLLKVPISSQTLVFSKTSLQPELVSPRTPRAIYFNDSVYVSWVPGGKAIDITAIDPNKGPMFYTLDQRARELRFTRDNQCFQCHLGPNTMNVPGPLLRSMVTAPDGRPLSRVEGFTIGHGSPFEHRWGGWYVTGAQPGFRHMGNSVTQFDAAQYLSPGSDAVALLVLAHQVQMHDLLTRANYETRYAVDPGMAAQSPVWSKLRIANAAEPLLEYMLFRDEAPLPVRLTGTSLFAEEFQKEGPIDSKGRSLRQLDLRTRLMRYPCSYLIYSDAFDALPADMKNYLWRRLFAILSGQDRGSTYATMSPADRAGVLEILRETKPEFATWCAANKKLL